MHSLNLKSISNFVNTIAGLKLTVDVKTIVAICCMFLTAIRNILSKLETYSANGYFANKLTEHFVVISKSEGLAIHRKR